MSKMYLKIFAHTHRVSARLKPNDTKTLKVLTPFYMDYVKIKKKGMGAHSKDIQFR